MKTQALHQKTMEILRQKIDSHQLQNLIKRFNIQISTNEAQLSSNDLFYKQANRQNTIKSRRNSKKKINLMSSTSYEQNLQQKTLIKDKAIFIMQNQTPYLHSTDTITNLYKRPSKYGNQIQDVILYNPPMEPSLLTRLKSLHLYYCKLQSFRDMGTGWSNLKQISVYYGQLMDLGGLGGFPCLQYLNVPFNRIQSISEVMFHPTIVSVDLECNLIKQMSQIQHLQTVQLLQYVNLKGNPVLQRKQNNRIINQKFEKIIDNQDQRLNEYMKRSKRTIWEIQQSHYIQSSNYLLKQFFQMTRSDQITVQSKHIHQINNYDKIFQIQNIIHVQARMHAEDSSQQSQLQLTQIIMAPLANFQSKQVLIDPIIKKYFLNKLYTKEQKNKINQKLQTIDGQIKLLKDVSKPKIQRVSRLALTGFIQKSTHQRQQQMRDGSKEIMSTNLEKKAPFKRRTKLSLPKQAKGSLFNCDISQDCSTKNQNRFNSLNKFNRLFKSKGSPEGQLNVELKEQINLKEQQLANLCKNSQGTATKNSQGTATNYLGRQYTFKRRKHLSKDKSNFQNAV